MKKLIGIFLLLMLSVQILPLKEVGNMIFSSQFNEEIPHSIDCGKQHINKFDGKSDFLEFNSAFVKFDHHLTTTSVSEMLDAAIPSNHSFEILVPPPNA